MVPRRVARLAFIVAPLAALAVACEHNPAEPGALASITVTRAAETIPISTSVAFTAAGYDANGRVVGINPVWSIAAGGGTIGTDGVFSAGTVPGVYAGTVTATVGSLSGTASVTVTAGPVATITVNPTPVTLATSTNQQFTAVGKDAAGNVVAITPNWSLAAGGGSISATGLFTSGSVAGTFTNTATASVGSIKGTATVTVTASALALITVTPNPVTLAVGGNQTFTATGKDVNGNAVTVTPTWSVVAGGGAIVSATGVFTAGTTSGIFANTVRATSGAVSGFATVTVNPGALATITVTPTPITIATGAAQQFAAVGRDANGNIIPILPVWAKVGAGTINAAGLFVAGGAGAFADTVRATSGAVFGRGVVNIVAATPLAAITVTPNPANVNVAGAQQFTATGLDAGGAIVPISPAPTWSVVPAVGGGTINSGTGLFTAGGVAGSFVNAIQATSGSISGFASVNVTSSASVGPSLGTAEAYAVLGSTAVSCIGVSTVFGNIGVAPAGSISGFPAPCVIAAPGDGILHINDAPAIVAQADVTPAYNALAAMPCGADLSSQDLGGMTLAPGVYCFSSSAQLTGNLTLAGPATGLWVFQVGTALTTGTSSQVILSGGALARNVFWQVGSSATLGQTTIFTGNIIAAVSVTLVQGATLTGRALSKAGVTLDGNTITLP